MRLSRLAKLFLKKYKFAANPAGIEHSLRKKINILWDYPNKLFTILKACAESHPSKPQNQNDKIAISGYKFCKNLLSIIDYLKINGSSISLGELREVLNNLIHLINDNKDIKINEKNGIQFPHVSELIFQIIPISKKHDIKLRNEQFSKAKTGLSRILGLSLDMLNDLSELETLVPDKFEHTQHTKLDIDEKLPENFSPQRAPVSENDIIDFIRQHGDDYGISSKEDWSTIFMDNPTLKEEITTVINALNRGHYPKNDIYVKNQITDILNRVKELKKTNSPLFEDVE